MKIILLSILPMNDPRSWSGINQHVLEQLSQKHEVESIYSKKAHKAQQNLARISRNLYKFFGRKLNVYFNRSVAKIYGRYASNRITHSKADLIIALGPATTIAYLNTHIKTFLVSDACFDLLNEGYAGYQHLSKRAIELSRSTEKKGFLNADLIFLTSSWASEGLLRNNAELGPKIRHINFGSNIVPEKVNIRNLPADKQQLQLLIFGHDAKRKGVKDARKLANAIGCKLLVIGEEGWVSKKHSKGIFQDAYQGSHFLLLFSKADCTPIVVNEAGAFGLPTLSYNVGGLPDIVSKNQNGHLVQDVKEAQAILLNMSDEEYQNIQKSTLIHYSEKLSWQKFEERILKEFEA